MNLTQLLDPLIVLAIAGLVKWIWNLQKDLNLTKLDLAKNYHGKDELREIVEKAVAPLTREIERLARAIEKDA